MWTTFTTPLRATGTDDRDVYVLAVGLDDRIGSDAGLVLDQDGRLIAVPLGEIRVNVPAFLDSIGENPDAVPADNRELVGAGTGTPDQPPGAWTG
jgi:hypothetical protein